LACSQGYNTGNSNLKSGILFGGRARGSGGGVVEYLIEHPNEARKMGENGRKAVVVKYNWETESKKLIDVYENLLRGR